MNIAADIGNSRVKLGYFEGEMLVAQEAHPHETLAQALPLSPLWQKYSPVSKYLGLVSVGKGEMVDTLLHIASKQPGLLPFHIGRDTQLPIVNSYHSPQTLGLDRLIAASAALRIAGTGHLLVANAGTALTLDYVDHEGHFLGGTISPGLRTRFRALNTFTAALPLVEPEGNLPDLGQDTETCIRAGVVWGIVAEILAAVERYQARHPKPIAVFLTGGDTAYLGNLLKCVTFADANLLLHGINTIITQHAL